ncbi:MAG: ABC transporter ATP-binding protein, partial [Acidimicrobiales bacterium]|nr:ABC transporter ATP-binding protein [Acidimicrobiales bacterium]
MVLEARGLWAGYRDDNGIAPAVRDVNLVLHRGEVLGLAGESGSGKSTLAYAMTRLLRTPGVITGGEVTFHDARDVSSGGLGSVAVLDADPAELRRLRWSEVAIVFQSAMHALNPVLTVESQLTDVIAAHRPEVKRAGRHERAVELLNMVRINPDRLRSYPHELSGGMRQRVMIAMALALEPQVVVLDEPTTALDVVTQRQILAEMMSLRDRLGFA